MVLKNRVHTLREERLSMRRTSLLLALSLTVASTAAYAQRDPLEARFEQGRSLRRDHRDAEALTVFQQIYDEGHQSRALAQVGLAEAALGRWADAESHIAQALAQPDAWVTQNRSGGVALEQQLQRIATHLGSLEVVCDAPGATVWIGDRRMAALPLSRPLRIEVGRVTFEVRAEGYTSSQRVADVVAGGLARETVTLTRTLAVTSAANNNNNNNTVTLPGSGASATSGATRATTPPANATTDSGSTLRTLAWVSAGGALLFLAGGGVSYAVASSAAERWNDDSQCLRPGSTREQTCGADQSTANTMTALEVVGFVGGAALAATSAVLFVVSRPRERERATALTCGVGIGALGVSCGARF